MEQINVGGGDMNTTKFIFGKKKLLFTLTLSLFMYMSHTNFSVSSDFSGDAAQDAARR